MSFLIALLTSTQIGLTAGSAVSSTTSMYEWFCQQPGKAETTLCMQRKLSTQLRAATDETTKKSLQAQLTAINAKAREKPPTDKGLPGTRSLLIKEFSEMKMVLAWTR